jgi:hypothetical protein
MDELELCNGYASRCGWRLKLLSEFAARDDLLDRQSAASSREKVEMARQNSARPIA